MPLKTPPLILMILYYLLNSHLSPAQVAFNAAGYMGIGTKAPATALHVKKDNEAIRVEGLFPSIGLYNSTGIYKGFLWQGPDENISIGTSVGNINGRLEFYNNGTLNMSLSKIGALQLSGSSPYLQINDNGSSSGEVRGNNNNIEISARKSQSGKPGNLILQSNDTALFGNAFAGNVGIKTRNPQNTLQIGSAIGFSGNDICIGNGIQGMSFFQSQVASYWYTNTNFTLMPAGNGVGNLGINTITPTEKLEVNGNIKLTGEVNRSATGLTNMLPIAFGSVSSEGGIYSGSGNFTVTRFAKGCYQIIIDNESYNISGYVAFVSPIGVEPRHHMILPYSPAMNAYIYATLYTQGGSAYSELVNCEFTFIVYKP